MNKKKEEINKVSLNGCDSKDDEFYDLSKCDHSEYDTKNIIDFQFNVCRNCGYQWKNK